MIFKFKYPNNETNKEIVITSSIAAILLYLLLIIYQPFGTNQYMVSFKYVLLFPYAIISGFSFFFVNYFFKNQKEKWTIGLELFKIFIILFIISCFSYLYNTFFLSKVNVSLKNYLYMFAYTTALGFPVVTIYVLARYIYLNSKKSSLIEIINFEESIIKSDDQIELDKNTFKKSLYIQSDYSDYIDIDLDDFIFAESADNYCMLYFYRSNILQKKIIRISLTKLLSQIQSDEIKRIHRCYIVNLKKVSNFKGNSSGYKISVEKIEKKLIISRSYIDSVLPILEKLSIRP